MSEKSKKKMCRPIALFIPSLNGGGAQKVVVNLANALVDLTEHPIHVVLVKKEGVFLSELREEVAVIDLHSSRTLFSIFALRRYLLNVRPISIMSSMNYVNIVCSAASVLAGKPSKLILREANVFNRTSGWNIKSVLSFSKSRLMRMFYSFSDTVILNSNSTLETLEKNTILGKKSRTKVIYNPIAIDQNTKIHEQFERRRYICAIGRLVKQKGFDVLIEAFSQITDKDIELVILGEGPLESDLKKISNDLGLVDRVHFPGFVTPVASVLKNAQAFVLSSRWEGFGNVIVEALALGVPVVATDCPGGPREILEDGQHGILVKPESVDDLVRGINTVLFSPVGDFESRLKRSQNFMPNEIAKRYLEVMLCNSGDC